MLVARVALNCLLSRYKQCHLREICDGETINAEKLGDQTSIIVGLLIIRVGVVFSLSIFIRFTGGVILIDNIGSVLETKTLLASMRLFLQNSQSECPRHDFR